MAASVPYGSATGTRSVGTSGASAEPESASLWRIGAPERRVGSGAATVLVVLKLSPAAASSTGLQSRSAAASPAAAGTST